MKTVACHECGHPFDAKLKVCPRCGVRQPSAWTFIFGVGAALLVAAVLLFSTTIDFSGPAHDAAPMPESDVGPGTKYANDHPELLANVKYLINAQGYRCPKIVNLWNEPNPAGGNRLEALCGPDASHLDVSMHYAVYAERRKVNRCQPWKEFGPDCT